MRPSVGEGQRGDGLDASQATAVPATRAATILIVDDEATIRDFLCSALEAEGYAVMAAGDGADALALCEHYRPDVILLDLMMPRLDGLGFLQAYRLRHGGLQPDATLVFIMSAVRTAVDGARTSDLAGAFVKPFDLDDVIARIGQAVAARSGAAG